MPDMMRTVTAPPWRFGDKKPTIDIGYLGENESLTVVFSLPYGETIEAGDNIELQVKPDDNDLCLPAVTHDSKTISWIITSEDLTAMAYRGQLRIWMTSGKQKGVIYDGHYRINKTIGG